MTGRTCIVCGQDLQDEPQTCVRCLSRTRSALLEIVDRYADLSVEMAARSGASGSVAGGTPSAESPVVGGDAMVLLGPGSDGANQIRDMIAGRNVERVGQEMLGGSHQLDEWDSDPDSVLGVLESWDRDWRHTLGLRLPDTPATVAGCANFLTGHLTTMAQRHPAFDEFATDMRRLLASVQRAVADGEHVERGVPCLDCGTQLVRRARRPMRCDHDGPHRSTCDQGGLGDWRCPSRQCQRTRYSEEDYLLACAEHWRKHVDSQAC